MSRGFPLQKHNPQESALGASKSQRTGRPLSAVEIPQRYSLESSEDSGERHRLTAEVRHASDIRQKIGGGVLSRWCTLTVEEDREDKTLAVALITG